MANDLIRIRRDIYTNWSAANPVLALGEISYDLTNDEIRVGDGTTAWLSLPAVGSANLSDGDKGDIVVSSGGTVWSLSSALVAEIAAKLEASDLNLGTSTTPATTPLQIRRGNTLSWTGVVLQPGEIGFDSQLNEIRIGDGITDWDNLDPVGLNKLQNLSLEQIGDVEIADLTPGDVLIHDGTNWINLPIQFPATDLDDLTSVTLASPSLGQVLTFNGTVWVNSTPSVLSAGVKNDINVVSDSDWQIVDDSVTQAKLNLDLPVNPWDAATKDYTDTTVGLGVMSIEDQFGQPNGPAMLDSTQKIATASLATGTASSSTFLRGDRVWTTISAESSTLDGLTDVTLATITDEQPLVYETSTSQWKNRNVITLDALTFNTSASAPTILPGKIYWDTAKQSLVTPLSTSVVSEFGLTTHIKVLNNSGNQLLLGRVVRATGSQTQQITVSLAGATTAELAATTLGLVTQLIDDGTSGFIISNGLLRGINTNLLVNGTTPAEGDAIWLDTVLGEMTVDRPAAPNHAVFIGWLIKLGGSTTGEIFVKIINGFELDEIRDVLITTPITGHVLRYNGTVWANAALTTADVTGLDTALAGKAATTHSHAAGDITSGIVAAARLGSGTADSTTFLRGDNTWQTVSGGATNLDGLSDVTITTPATGQTLKYNGTVWANSALAIADVTSLQTALDGKAATSHTHAGEDITSGTIAAARLGSGTTNVGTYLRGDNTWYPFNIDALTDVSVGVVTDKQPLAFDGGTLQWTNRTVIRLDALELNTAPAAQSVFTGKIYWDTGSNDLVTPLSGSVLSEIGITNHTRVFNNTGDDILRGRVVRVTGSQGQKITVALANASSETTAATTIGIAAEIIPDAAEAFIITTGLLRGLNTNLLIKGTTPSDGDALWLNTVDGEITVDRPTAPNHGVFLGWLIRLGSGTSGEIFVKVNNGSELEELHDVLITTPITGHVLRYNGTVWANAALAASDITTGTIATARLGSGTADSTTFLRGDNTWQTISGGATNLDGLSDVTITSPATSQTLKYNGTAWVNNKLSLADILELGSPVNGQILAVSSGAWTATSLNAITSTAKLDPIGITPSTSAGRILLTSKLDALGVAVDEVVHGNFIDTATIDATFEDRSIGSQTAIAKWKFDVKDSSIGTTKLGGDITTAGKALLDDADAAAQRTTLGLGTAATSNTTAFAAASHTHAAGDITTGTIATARLGSGTADSTTFLRGDNTWQTVSGGATNLDGLSDVVITTPASNNLLGYNGTNWINRAVNDAIGDGTLGVGKLSQGTATNGQVLAWNNLASSWAPADPSGGGATPQGSEGAIQYNSAGSFEGATSALISANGNIKLNDSTESSGIAESTILFSKSFAGRSLPTILSGSACPATNLQVCLGRNRIAWVNFSGAATTLSTFGITLSVSGTAGGGSFTVSGGTQLARQMRTTYTNTIGTNAFAGVRTASSQVWRGTVANSGGFHIVYRFGRSDALSACSEYHGVSGTTSAPGASQVDPTALGSYVNKFGIGLRTSDTNYQLMHCTGTAVATVVDTGIAAVQNVSYRLELFWEPGNSTVMKWLLVREDNNTSATGSASSNLPAQDTALCFTSHRCTVGNNAQAIHNFISYYHEQIGLA